MEYCFKQTTHGIALTAACLTCGVGLELTRVSFGSGLVSDGTNLADVHALVNEVADGRIGELWHKDNWLYFSVQYTNADHPKIATFPLSEFMVYARNPDTGQETDFLYATLGDYRQPVPQYTPTLPPGIWTFSVEMVLSNDVQIINSAPVGLVTDDRLLAAIAAHNADKNAHINLPRVHVISTRERDKTKPTYGLGGGGDTIVALDAGPHTGTAEVSVIVSGIEYDARNMSTSEENAPSGTLILKKVEDT